MKDSIPPDIKVLAAELKETPVIKLEMDPAAAFAIIAGLQLALRHPNYPPDSRRFVGEFVCDLSERFGPVTKQVIEMGFETIHDVDWSSDVHEMISDEEFNAMLRGPLHHPLPQFTLSRLMLALRHVVDVTGSKGIEALRMHCRHRQEKDGRDG
jgi:hypothetical protein